jgi:cellobiose-specific phosphotransferase system component IIC
LPWFGAIALMLNKTYFARHDVKVLQSVIFHFASPRRIALHMLSVVARAVLTPLLQLVFGIAVKRLLGLNTACAAANTTQLASLRRYINSVLLSRQALHKAFTIIGSHYEIVSVSKVFWMWGIHLVHNVVDHVSSNGSEDRPENLLAWYRNLLS